MEQNLPAIIVLDEDGNQTYHRRIEVLGSCGVLQAKEDSMLASSIGAKVWIETDSEIQVIE